MIRIKEPVLKPPPRVKINWLPYGPTVTKKKKRPVTKSPKLKPRNTPEKGGDRRTGKVKAPSPPPAPVSSAGRPKVHATSADRQRAYRERQKVKA